MSSADGILHCVLKTEWFEKIKSGEKTHEYRVVKDYWFKKIYTKMVKNSWGKKIRIVSVDPFMDKIRFSLGMTSDPEKIMLFKIKSITEVDGKNTDLKYGGLVYDIELGRRLKNG